MLPRAIAWGEAGYQIVATIAQSRLEPQVLDSVCSILGTEGEGGGDAPCYLSAVALWADGYRRTHRWSAPWHDINPAGDHLPDKCDVPGAEGWEGEERAKVLDAIQNATSILTDFVSGSATMADGAPELALKLLIHFVGDLHQPLHLSSRDRGGNDFKVKWDGRQTNGRQIRETDRGANYDPYVRRIVWEGLGVGRRNGRWPSHDWLKCPQAANELEQPPPQEVLVPAATAPRKKPKPRPGNGPPSTSDSDCLYSWAYTVYGLNCEVVWPPESDASSLVIGPELDEDEYTGIIEKDWVVEILHINIGAGWRASRVDYEFHFCAATVVVRLYILLLS